MTITEQLEGLLPADGNYTTKDERVIAEAELREAYADVDLYADALEDEKLTNHNLRAIITQQDKLLNDAQAMLVRKLREVASAAILAFAAGCIASAIYVVLV